MTCGSLLWALLKAAVIPSWKSSHSNGRQSYCKGPKAFTEPTGRKVGRGYTPKCQPCRNTVAWNDIMKCNFSKMRFQVLVPPLLNEPGASPQGLAGC